MFERMKINFGNFISFYRDYFRGNRSKEDMTLICTQPFWQSMILSKKRLDEKGLTMELECEDERETLTYGETFRTSTIHIDDVDVSDVVERPTNVSATAGKRLSVTRRIMRGGKELYKDSGEKLVTMSQMKENVDSAYVVCPNCGHTSTVSSFIDGCDHCNTKFQVYDAEVKVSSFNVEKDYGKKTKKQSTGLFKKLGKLFIALLIIEFIMFICACVYDIAVPGETAWNTKISIILATGVIIIVVAGCMLLSAGIVVLATWMTFDGRKFTRIKHNSVLDKICTDIPEFSAEAFTQNLEMKLRNIHMTDRATEVNVFAHVDLSEVVSGYRDIIDCSLAHISFLDYKDNGFTYEILVNARMELLRYNGADVQEDYESIYILLSGQSGMNEDDIRAVSMYKCESCGNSVSLLNGGVCDHCGQRLPYEKHSLIIERYYADMTSKEMNRANTLVCCGKSKAMSEAKKARVQLVGLFATMVVVTLGLSALICEDLVLEIIRHL